MFPLKIEKISFMALAEYKKSSIFATLLEKGIHNPNEKFGRLAQLVQSICLTSRGSGVRIPQRPQ